MSESCRFCSVVSRNACSSVRKKYLREELMSCGNINYDPDRLASALWSGGVGSEEDFELAEYKRRYGDL